MLGYNHNSAQDPRLPTTTTRWCWSCLQLSAARMCALINERVWKLKKTSTASKTSHGRNSTQLEMIVISLMTSSGSISHTVNVTDGGCFEIHSSRRRTNKRLSNVHGNDLHHPPNAAALPQRSIFKWSTLSKFQRIK